MKKKALLLFEDRMIYPDGAIIEMRIWKLPEEDAERPHGLKYSLFYGFAGERIIGYDNERGKGDHRHYRDQEMPYEFSDPHRLMTTGLAQASPFMARSSETRQHMMPKASLYCGEEAPAFRLGRLTDFMNDVERERGKK